MTKFDHVKARFGGQDLTFKIDRADLDLFEAFGTPAFALFRAVTAGLWTVKDLKFVLAFAVLKPATIARLRLLAGPSVDLRQVADHLVQSKSVDGAFANKPPGLYVPLVQAVLAAALLGIDEADAVFTDEADGA